MNSITRSSWSTIKDILPFFWDKDIKIKLRLLTGTILILISIFFSISVPLVLKSTINMLTTNINLNLQLALLILTYGIFWMLGKISENLRLIVIYPVVERSIRVLAVNLLQHIHRLPYAFYLDKKTGFFTNIIQRVQSGVPNLFFGFFLFVLPTIIEISIAVGILWYLYGFLFGLALAVILMIYIFTSILGTKWSIKAQRIANDKASDADGRVVESLMNYETVKYFANDKYEVRKCDKYLAARERAMSTQHVRGELVILYQNIIIGLGLIFLTMIAGLQVAKGLLKVGDFVLVNGYILQFVAPLNMFGFIFRNMREGITNLEGVADLLQEPSEVQDQANIKTKLVRQREKGINFDSVTFGYNKNDAFLKDINFKIEPGQKVAIVGPTGSGKSTLVKLLFRLYEIDKGAILIDGIDIRELNKEYLRKMIGIVPQETFLFHDTIFNNIAYSYPSASNQEVIDAINAAHLNTLIDSLPEGYNTLVGERGLKLSGGEKQRIGIARAFLKKPSLYIFDESTSALDSRTEQLIQVNLNEISRNVTTIIITHRLTTIVNADKIFVLDKGCLIESGSFDQLLANNGLFKKLWSENIKNMSSDESKIASHLF